MEWVEVTAKSVESAKELALDRFGISVDDAEFDVVEAPRPGLFGRVRGEARVRARVKPAMVRQKQERRGRRSSEPADRSTPASLGRCAAGSGGPVRRRGGTATEDNDADRSRRRADSGPARRVDRNATSSPSVAMPSKEGRWRSTRGRRPSRSPSRTCVPLPRSSPEAWSVPSDFRRRRRRRSTAARSRCASTRPAMVSACSSGRVGGHCWRSRISPGSPPSVASATTTPVCASTSPATGRSVAPPSSDSLGEVAELVKQSGVARSLEPMPSSDRKVVHDTLTTIDGVASRSEGEDPYRRIIVSPA